MVLLPASGSASVHREDEGVIVDSDHKVPFDLLIVGGGILGISVAAWMANLFEGRMAILEKEQAFAIHTTSRNTGVVHRPFYLDPVKKKTFARSAQISFPFWREWARRKGLPWVQRGTLEVATEPSQLATIRRYLEWGKANGMEDSELEILDAKEVARLEPRVSCEGAIHCLTDTCVNYFDLAASLLEEARSKGMAALGGSRVTGLSERDGMVEVRIEGLPTPFYAKCLVNCAGGSSLDLARMLNVGGEYEDLHFRGEYRLVDADFGKSVSRNAYSVPRHTEFPFLDPHFIVRADGRREVGPNAVLVGGPYVYRGIANSPMELISKLVERPMMPKLRLITSSSFISLVSQEWRSSLSASEMCARVKRFIPSLTTANFVGRGIAGVRSSVIGPKGFVPEAIELSTAHSYHVLNYNSPGATGAPAYAALVVSNMMRSGHLEGLKPKGAKPFWDFDDVMTAFRR